MSTTNLSAEMDTHAKPRAKAPDVEEDPSLEYLLFCETLLEEYEGLAQPELNPTELEKIKSSIARYRVKEECQRRLDEPDFEGKTIKRIYHLINEAQAAHLRRTRAGFEERFNDIRDTTERKKAVDKAVVAQIFGESEDLSQSNGGASYENSITPLDAEKLNGTTLRSALCLSGGGIRSATFNLGILQGLARHGLLEKFDYLSTVSGGGFIGGWLSAWIRREGIGKVVAALKNPPQTPITPDPPPVEHLRVYSNYLSPQPGLISADSWTLVATVIRNLILNWLVFVPVLLAILLLPRMWTSIVLRSSNYPEYAIPLSLLTGFFAAVWALSYIVRNLPSSNDYTAQPTAAQLKGGQGRFLFRCLIWLVVSAAAMAVCLWSCYQPGRLPLSWRHYTAFAMAIIIVPLIIFVARVIKITPAPSRNAGFATKLVVASLLILGVQVIIGYLASSLVLLSLPIFHRYPAVYSIFSVPLILLLMGVQGLLITGFTSRFSKDDDQEWWGRAGAWILMIAVAWSLVHLLVLFGPLMLLSLEATYRNMWNGGLSNLTWADVGKLFGTVAGIVSGAITLLGGFSAKTPANSKEAEKAGTGGLVLGILTQLLAPVFLGFVIVLLSLATNWLLISRPSQALSRSITGYSLPSAFSPLWRWHMSLIQQTPFRLLVILWILIAIFGIVMGRLISTNVFSLQFMWRNRIMHTLALPMLIVALIPSRVSTVSTTFKCMNCGRSRDRVPRVGNEKIGRAKT